MVAVAIVIEWNVLCSRDVATVCVVYENPINIISLVLGLDMGKPMGLMGFKQIH